MSCANKLSDEELALLRLGPMSPMEATGPCPEGDRDVLTGAQQTAWTAQEKQETWQSVNERLEKAIEQLRHTSHALQATNQELCSLNNELEMMNEEVEILRKEVNRLGEDYTHTLDHMPYPVVLVDTDGKIRVWNAAAQQLFNLAPDAAIGIDLSEIPVQPSLGQALSREHRAVVERGVPLMLRNQLVHVQRAIHRMDVQFASLNRDHSGTGVLVMFMSNSARDGVVSRCEQNNLMDGAAS